MTYEYKPHGLYDASIDPERCKASVPFGGRSVGFHQCQRKPKIDGWCKQHHPDTEAARHEASMQRSKVKRERSPAMRAIRSRERLEKVTKQRDALLAALEAVEWVRMEGIGYLCPWCLEEYTRVHKPDCPRQAAIAAATKEKDETQSG